MNFSFKCLQVLKLPIFNIKCRFLLFFFFYNEERQDDSPLGLLFSRLIILFNFKALFLFN